jgi:hypothetical protein
VHYQSFISLLDIHLIDKRCGLIDCRHREANSQPRLPQRSKPKETTMYAKTMTALDRTAWAFAMILAAMPFLSIAVNAAIL